MKRLLAPGDVDPEKPDARGQAPLWGVKQNVKEGVVELLLGQGDGKPPGGAN